MQEEANNLAATATAHELTEVHNKLKQEIFIPRLNNTKLVLIINNFGYFFMSKCKKFCQ